MYSVYVSPMENISGITADDQRIYRAGHGGFTAARAAVPGVDGVESIQSPASISRAWTVVPREAYALVVG